MKTCSISLSPPGLGEAESLTSIPTLCRITSLVIGLLLLIGGCALIAGAFSQIAFMAGCGCAVIGMAASAISFCKLDFDSSSSPVEQEPDDAWLSRGPHIPERSVPTPPLSAPPRRRAQSGAPPPPPYSTLEAPSQLAAQPAERATIHTFLPNPTLPEIQQGLRDSVHYLGQFASLLNQRGIETHTLYDGNRLNEVLERGLSTLPLEIDLETLNLWKALMEAVTQVESSLCSAFYKRFPPRDIAAAPPVNLNMSQFSAGTMECRSPVASIRTPSSPQITFNEEERGCLVNLSKSLDPVRWFLAKGFYLKGQYHDVSELIKGVP